MSTSLCFRSRSIKWTCYRNCLPNLFFSTIISIIQSMHAPKTMIQYAYEVSFSTYTMLPTNLFPQKDRHYTNFLIPYVICE